MEKSTYTRHRVELGEVHLKHTAGGRLIQELVTTESPNSGRIQELVTTDSPYIKLCALLQLEKSLLG